MNRSDETFIDDVVRDQLASPVPAEVERPLREQLAQFRIRPSASEQALIASRWSWSRSAWWGLAATCTAAAVILVASVALKPRISFAQVASAVLEQPWIHARSVRSDGKDRRTDESWFSPSKNVLAWRNPESIDYRDYRLQTYYSYDPAEGVLYRGPTAEQAPLGHPEWMVTAMRLLMQQDKPPARPLEQMRFLGTERDKMKVVDQKMERVTDRGRAWLEYRLTVAHGDSPQPLRLTFRVDGVSKLPKIFRMESEFGGKPVSAETEFDYPEKGPADIHELGVPENTKLVDRVPTGDLKRITETLRAGRERMDPYRAVFVWHMDGPGLENSQWSTIPMVFYRKGSLLRADYVARGTGDRGEFKKRPASGENLSKWWFARTKLYQFFPQYVVRDSLVYTSMTKLVKDSDGSEHRDIKSVLKTEYNVKPEEMVPPEYSMRPEYACRPPMGVGNQHQEPVLDLKPTDGPPGCILLSVRLTSDRNRVQGMRDAIRYWLDPKRDCIVMRCDMLERNAAGKEVVVESDLTEGIARSPQGVWYATKIRRKTSLADGKPNPNDQIYDIYVDFDVQLPDAFFEPPQPGRLY
jgi:hypothetical protein